MIKKEKPRLVARMVSVVHSPWGDDLFMRRFTIAVLSFVAFVLFTAVIGDDFGGDGTMYALQSRLIAEGFHPLLDFLSSEMDGFLYFFAGVFQMFGFDLFFAKATVALLRVASVIPFAFLLWRVYRLPFWVLAVFLFISNYYFALTDGVFHSQLVLPLVTWSVTIIGFLQLAQSARSFYFLALCLGLVTGFCASVRIIYVGLIVPNFLFFILILRNRSFPPVVSLAGFFLGVLFGALLLLLQVFQLGFSEFLFLKGKIFWVIRTGIRSELPDYARYSLFVLLKMGPLDKFLLFFNILLISAIVLSLAKLVKKKTPLHEFLASPSELLLLYAVIITLGIYGFHFFIYQRIAFQSMLPIIPLLVLSAAYVYRQLSLKQKSQLVLVGVFLFGAFAIQNRFAPLEVTRLFCKAPLWVNPYRYTVNYFKLHIVQKNRRDAQWLQVQIFFKDKGKMLDSVKVLDFRGLFAFETGMYESPRIPSLGGPAANYYMSLLTPEYLSSQGLPPEKVKRYHLMEYNELGIRLHAGFYDVLVYSPGVLKPVHEKSLTEYYAPVFSGDDVYDIFWLRSEEAAEFKQYHGRSERLN